MSSAWERIIRRQQYRFSPSSSRTLRGSSPPRVRSMNAGNELPTTLPHVKHLTGMIMGSPVRFLALLPGPTTQGLLRQLAPGVRDDQRAIVFAEDGLEIVVIQVLNEAAGDRRADCVRLPHHAAALYVHVDVDRVDFLPRELQRLEDLQSPQFERIDFDGHAIDPPHASPLPQSCPRARRLAHSARGAAALVAGPVLLEDDALFARDDRLLRIHHDNLLAVQEPFREDGGQSADDVTGRIDRRHRHPMIRMPDPFGFWTASSRRVMVRPPAASIFFRAAADVRNAATVTGVLISPVASTTPGTTICSPLAAYRLRRERLTSDQFLRVRSRRSATSRQIGAVISRETARGSPTPCWRGGVGFGVLAMKTGSRTNAKRTERF